MSRSLTPKELLAFEDAVVSTGGMSVLETMAGLVFQHEGCEPVRLYSDAEIAARREFPLLGKLMGSGEYGFMRMYERLQKVEGGLDWLKAEDMLLEKYIERGHVKRSDMEDVDWPPAVKRWFESPTVKSYQEKDGWSPTAVRWFEGELAPQFYYREENDRFFVEYLLDEAMSFSGNQNEAYALYRINWRKEHGISQDEVDDLFGAYHADKKAGRFVGCFNRYEQEFGYENCDEQMKSLEELVDNGLLNGEQRIVEDLLRDAVEKCGAAGSGQEKDKMELEQ